MVRVDIPRKLAPLSSCNPAILAVALDPLTRIRTSVLRLTCWRGRRFQRRRKLGVFVRLGRPQGCGLDQVDPREVERYVGPCGPSEAGRTLVFVHPPPVPVRFRPYHGSLFPLRAECAGTYSHVMQTLQTSLHSSESLDLYGHYVSHNIVRARRRLTMLCALPADLRLVLCAGSTQATGDASPYGNDQPFWDAANAEIKNPPRRHLRNVFCPPSPSHIDHSSSGTRYTSRRGRRATIQTPPQTTARSGASAPCLVYDPVGKRCG
ncbi:hypothetical protein BC628DRAFT_189904 [Trametes gibbosa]|nr:hypothetical protein BC628DRAFT_189904 [Trametes gibbosa]